MPAESEKRTVTGVDGLTACGALVRFSCAGRGGEGPDIHQTLGVSGAETTMDSSGKLIEDVEQFAREFRGHDANLQIMITRNQMRTVRWSASNT